MGLDRWGSTKRACETDILSRSAYSRLEEVGQLVELAHRPARIPAVVARECGRGGAPVELLGVLEEEEDEHERRNKGRERQVECAAQKETPAEPSDVVGKRLVGDIMACGRWRVNNGVSRLGEKMGA